MSFVLKRLAESTAETNISSRTFDSELQLGTAPR